MSTTTAIAPVLRVPARPTESAELVVVDLPDSRGGVVRTLVKKTDRGLVRAMRHELTLDAQAGHTYLMSVKDVDGQWRKARIVTAAGYDEMNKFLGVWFHNPPTVGGPDGKMMPNPYCHRVDGELQYVTIRMVAIGRSSNGNLLAMENTVTFDLRTYFAQDMVAKWRGRKKDQPRAWGKMMRSELVPNDVRSDALKVVVPLSGGVALVVDLSSTEAMDLFCEHTNRLKFAERLAQTICRRNLLKRFTAISRVPDDGRVTLTCWPTLDRDIGDINELVQQASEGRVVVGGEELAVTRSNDTVAAPTDIEAAVTGTEDSDMPPTDAPEDEPPAPGIDIPAVREHAAPPAPAETPVSETPDPAGGADVHPAARKKLKDELSMIFDGLSDGKKAAANGALRRALKLDIDGVHLATKTAILHRAIAIVASFTEADGPKPAPAPDAGLLGDMASDFPDARDPADFRS